MINVEKTSIKQIGTKLIITINQPIKIILPLGFSVNLLVVFLRCIKDSSGNFLFNYQDISEIFGKSYRQWSHNIYKLWDSSGENIKLFIEDKREVSQEVLNEVSKFVLLNPLRSVLEQHREFTKAYPEHSTLCINVFRHYVSAIDCSKLITSLGKQLSEGKLNLRASYFVKVLLAQGKRVSSSEKSYISELFPSSGQELLPILRCKDIDWNSQNSQKYLLVSLLYIYGVSQDKIALLFGVSKTSVHNWVHKILNKELKYTLLKMITKWSGKICVDEKWIRINGKWQYVLSAVDAITGVPLLSSRFDCCDTATWTLFFKEFKLYYNIPTLVISDGSNSLLAGLKIVFKGVRHQLCWFHKLKNLHKRIYQIKDGKLRERAFVLAKGMFNNNTISSRKYAAKKLVEVGGEGIASYITKSFLKQWLKLTLCLTSNAAERYNRKIEKCINCRYGVKNEKCADALINGLWLSDILIRGSVHCENNNQFENINLAEILKVNFQHKQILHFSGNEKAKNLNNVA
ncbi:MAG: IS6 family transposase [Colwellia sp.]|nr:IS6 family transposase [Colwellia sp.]